MGFYLRYDIGREIIKWIAIGTMTIDHIGAILFPQSTLLRIIGRLSFPLFSYLLVLGVESTRNTRDYLIRLIVFALISQVPFYMALGLQPFESLNIFFTLVFGVLFLLNPILFVLPILISFFLNFDYGVYGISIIACMRILRENTKMGVLLLVLLNILTFTSSTLQIFALGSLPIILLHHNGYLIIERDYDSTITTRVIRKYFFYVYYPLHLTSLYFIKTF